MDAYLFICVSFIAGTALLAIYHVIAERLLKKELK